MTGISTAAMTTVARLFAARAAIVPAQLAIVDGDRRLTYRELADRAARLAGVLVARGVAAGDRVAVLAENRLEVLELLLAAAHVGAIVACQNWRLAADELRHCLDLVEPALVVVSPRFRDRVGDALVLGDAYERALGQAAPVAPREVDPEAPLVILYTSGTTGRPKGAVIGHRAQIARNLVTRAELGIALGDAFVAWSPLYHMGAVDNSLGTLMAGGTVFVVDGFDPARLAELVASEPIGWLLLMPGMAGRFAGELQRRGIVARSVRLCGVMADLVPPQEIAQITTLLRAPYANTFGATETGGPPASTGVIPIGVEPADLAKLQSPFCEIRLVDDDDRDVAAGTPGEIAIRGPTVFSGYWRADEVNAHDFRGGWFHMGDMFVREPDGRLRFVGRKKYLIKTGGESVYPAEIERVLLQDPRVAEACVVRKPDAKWGEVPVAFVARRDHTLDEAQLFARCREQLAGYKQPKQIRFLPLEAFPRSTTGKIQLDTLEKLARKP